MSIIIISSEAYEEGLQIAKKTAEALGYACIDDSFILQIAEKHHLVPEKIESAMKVPARIFGISAKQRKIYLSYVQEAVLRELKQDDMVCCGLLAHLYVSGVSHVLKVRVLSDAEKHIKRVAQKNNITEKKASAVILKEKRQIQQWSSDLFRMDETDSSRYDLTISLNQIDTDDAVKIISETVSSRKFLPMTYSLKCMEDLALAAEVRASLVESFPNIRVRSENHKLIIETFGLKREKQKRITKINEVVSCIPGVDYFEVHFINDFFKQAAESFR
ncbi:MAG: cytidylate kinase-like family protein [Proteobacteria bacterium]|nr:cytidylate kinase-like family protein [Pseudomonadota bacterium]MBU4470219.1 cytidylate kinase-like family protein [Pseudomonadota bacterium]MCG2752635.1 cytidylate kinase-like family protein [Desulfobacteraceae bacterium]